MTTAFGGLIKDWRRKRSLSQMDLAFDTGTTPRHVSFLETGRSKPSQDMILRLSSAMEIPFRERNTLFRAAGYLDKYKQRALEDEDMAVVKNTIAMMLENHEPFPATVINRYWQILDMNETSRFMLEPMIAAVPHQGQYPNILEILFHPDGVRPRILNWEECARQVIQRVRREAFEDAEAEEQIKRLKALTDFPESWWAIDLDRAALPVVPFKIDMGEGRVASFFSLITSFGTPIDVTAQEIRVEMNFPADEATRQIFVNR